MSNVRETEPQLTAIRKRLYPSELVTGSAYHLNLELLLSDGVQKPVRLEKLKLPKWYLLSEVSSIEFSLLDDDLRSFGAQDERPPTYKWDFSRAGLMMPKRSGEPHVPNLEIAEDTPRKNGGINSVTAAYFTRINDPRVLLANPPEYFNANNN